MNRKFLLSCFTLVLLTSLVSAQYIVNDIIFSCNSVSNEGKVSGYEGQGGPYSIWLPDSANALVNLGGVAPGFGVGGQCRFSTDGNYLSGTALDSNGSAMARFDRSSNSWTVLGSFGFPVDGNFSGGYCISGDGNVVAGNSWTDTTGGYAFTHGVAWSATEGIMDLGTMFFGRSTRVNAANADGSVLVGWQDFNGPWKSAVWRKNPNGGYFANEYILLDTMNSPTDEYNQMGECSAVSADGMWIGGYGDYANNYQPWIWSRNSGVINLGSLPNLGNGYVSGMSADGSVVTGWFDGMFFGDPQTPFIWTQSSGLQELNAYIQNLGYSTTTYQAYTAECISPDGNYVAGYGVNTLTFSYFAYRFNINGTNSLNNLISKNSMNIYPNPSTDQITVDIQGQAKFIIRSADGKLMDEGTIPGKSTFSISGYAPGMYWVSVRTEEEIHIRPFIKQ